MMVLGLEFSRTNTEIVSCVIEMILPSDQCGLLTKTEEIHCTELDKTFYLETTFTLLLGSCTLLCKEYNYQLDSHIKSVLHIQKSSLIHANPIHISTGIWHL